MATSCFWTETTGEVELSLRRLSFDDDKTSDPCSSGVGHDSGSVSIGRASAQRSEDGYLGPIDPMAHDGDPRWPVACISCGYVFEKGDLWQVNQEPLYRRADTGEEHEMRRLPAGALFDATWYHKVWVGPDGISLMVVLPQGYEDARSAMWCPDGPPSDDRSKVPGWTRVGDPRDPPTLSVTPSINAGTEGQPGHYHSWLTAGVLGDG